jgi:glycosyltransferase involved in cell wall biosynthesis
MSLAGARCPFRLVVVGDGAQRRELEQEVRRRGLRERVRFDGFQPEARMPLYYSAADLSCLPSLAEGWPDALMESFACGCPAVASAVGGVPEIMALTGAGLTVPPASPDALAGALEAVLARDMGSTSDRAGHGRPHHREHRPPLPRNLSRRGFNPR